MEGIETMVKETPDSSRAALADTAIRAIEAWRCNRMTTYTPSCILDDFGDTIIAALRAPLPPALNSGADREKVCAHESCLDCVCPERNFCTGTYYRVLALPRAVEGGAVIEQCAKIAERRSGYVSCDPVFERGYYAGRELAAKEIRALPRAVEGGAVRAALEELLAHWEKIPMWNAREVNASVERARAALSPDTGDGK